nr:MULTISPECIES: transposase [unclassified Bradyrhizobium]
MSGPERRRRWTSAEKLRIVEESLAPGPVLSRLVGDMTFNAIWLRLGGGKRAQASSFAGPSRCSCRMAKCVLRQSPLRQTLDHGHR